MLLAGNRQNVASAPTTDSASRRNSDMEDPMLVLTRRGGESVRIGDDVTVTVLEDRGRPVRLGIDAPKEIPVHRAEVHERIREGMSQDSASPRSPAAKPTAP